MIIYALLVLQRQSPRSLAIKPRSNNDLRCYNSSQTEKKPFYMEGGGVGVEGNYTEIQKQKMLTSTGRGAVMEFLIKMLESPIVESRLVW